jgi:2-phosphosulfolactate phosphatase
VTELEQTGFDPRLEWAAEGATALARSCPVLVVVDVLRFTTAVEVALSGGATVVPHPWPPRPTPGVPDAAGSGTPKASAAPGVPGTPGPFSLSPVSLLGVPVGARVELASPNGATVSLAAAAAGAVVLAGCLRNASAVAAAARSLGGPVGVAAAGERWPDGTLRPAVEDLLGAGAVLHALGGHPSPEARSAVAAFLAAAPDLASTLADSSSGRELAARGRAGDLRLAAEHDVSRMVPVLRDGAFTGVDQPPLPGPRKGG